MKAYTDYPIEALGDTLYEDAPIRECELVSYDQTLYCEILVQGVIEYIKSGYVYKSVGRCGEVPCFTYAELCKLPVTEL